MPYRQRNRAPARATGRKPVRRYKKRSDPAPTINRGSTVGRTLLTKPPLFPVRSWQKGQLYYEPYFTLAPAIGSYAYKQISCNGLYDPNISGTGHQPIGFDQIMSLYEQYTTTRAHIKVTCINSGADACRVALFLSPDTSVPSITGIMENGLCKSQVIFGGSDGGEHKMCTLEMTCDIPRYFGRQWKEIIADPQMYGTIAANPGEQVYFTIAAWDPYSTSGDCQVAYDVTVTYDSLYWEPKKINSS